MTQLAIGEATPHGATYDGHGVNFTLFSAHAERVELCVFDSRGNERRYDLPGRRGDVWHGYLAGARPGLRYGYRVHGPWQPAQGHRFNPAKLLLDPYARRVEGELKDHPLLHGGHDEPDYRDNAAVAPKSVIISDHYDWEDDAAPRTPLESPCRALRTGVSHSPPKTNDFISDGTVLYRRSTLLIPPPSTMTSGSRIFTT